MARVFQIKPTAPFPTSQTVMLGAGTGASNNLSILDVGKFTKLTAESRYALAAAGDPLEAYITSVESATSNGYSIGGICKAGQMYVTFDGLEATAGTGTVALGDYVVVGTVTAKGTILPGAPKVCKATNQPGATVTSADNLVASVNAAIAQVTDSQLVTAFAWRVVSLGPVGTGAVGTVGVIEKV